MGDVREQLAKIVSPEFVSDHAEEQYLYARDPGTMPPSKPDYIVMPGTTEEVAAVVKLANDRKIPVIPMGAGVGSFRAYPRPEGRHYYGYETDESEYWKSMKSAGTFWWKLEPPRECCRPI